jgi:photosystem II stability/assembly factor-like uncharacterized protein
MWSRLQLEQLEWRNLLSGASLFSQPSWTPLGPAPIVPGLDAGADAVTGRIASIAADPHDPSVIYLAAAGGGVWKTTNAGNSWSPLTDDQATLFMGAIALASSNPDIIYAGTGEATNSIFSFSGRGVLKSSDAGSTWTLLGADIFNGRSISRIVVAPDDPDTVYVAVAVGGNTGIWRSTDGGATWTNTTTAISTTQQFSDVEIDPTNPQILFAAVGSFRGSAVNGVYKSTDGGDTWSVAGNFPQGVRDGRITVAIAPSNTQILYASIAGSGQGGTQLGQVMSIKKSIDGGNTWFDSARPVLDSQGWYGLPLAVDPSDPNTVYASAGGLDIVESTNGGVSWLDIRNEGNQPPHPDHHAFTFDANGRLLDGNDGGIWRLDTTGGGGLRWTDINANLQLTQFIGIAVDPADPTLAYGGSQDNGTSKYTGSLAWTLVDVGDGGFVRIDPANPQTVYHEFTNINLQRSDDGGRNWTEKTSGITVGDPSNFYVPYVMDPSNPQRLLLGSNRVYETTNRGDLWRPISQPRQGGWTTTAIVDSLATAASDPNTIYASAGGHLFVTFDDGVSWHQRDVPGVVDHFQDIQIDPTDNLTAFVVRDRFGGRHVFQTTDGGQTWADISGNLPDLPAYTLAQDPSTQALYVGMDDGVYFSTDQGGTWSRFGTGLPHAQVRDLQLLPDSQLLVAGTHGRGAWEVSTVQAVTPTVDSVVINDGSAQRSLVTSLTITFNTAVTLDPDAIEVRRQGHGLISLDVATSLVGGQTVAVVTFTGPHIINGSLPDGDYTLTVQADKVHNSSGQGLAADYTTTFFRLFGDSNGNGVIDFEDLRQFASTFGKSAGDPGYLAYFDYYGTGTVDFGDFIQLLRRIGRHV